MALYTNIPYNEAREAVQLKLDSHVCHSPPTHFLLDLLDIIFEKNYFRVGEQFYMQIKGVAMGSACAPSVANIFMERFESDFIYDPVANPFYENIKFWKHFIDDIFFIFKGPIEWRILISG